MVVANIPVLWIALAGMHVPKGSIVWGSFASRITLHQP